MELGKPEEIIEVEDAPVVPNTVPTPKESPAEAPAESPELVPA